MNIKTIEVLCTLARWLGTLIYGLSSILGYPSKILNYVAGRLVNLKYALWYKTVLLSPEKKELRQYLDNPPQDAMELAIPLKKKWFGARPPATAQKPAWIKTGVSAGAEQITLDEWKAQRPRTKVSTTPPADGDDWN